MAPERTPNFVPRRPLLRTFFIPARVTRTSVANTATCVCVIIPTYSPGSLALKLVEDIVAYNPDALVFVVDDSTPADKTASIAVLQKIACISPRVTLLHTPENRLKAGALNVALRYIRKRRREFIPEVVITADDDVVIDRSTIAELVTDLLGDEILGAVCSQCRVLNKNVNTLTRLQGLEYAGFNAIRLADEGFLRGPLVMHGMLTAFRASALYDAREFAEDHLIEDYEMTARLKSIGWSVRSAPSARAWTVVPETLPALWRQRTRWSYGGITVVAKARSCLPVLQDLVGHTVFLLTLAMVGVLLLSRGTGAPLGIARFIIGVSILQFALFYVFQLWLMRTYQEKDRIDWLLRATVVPELIYGYLMTLALIGSYSFLVFNILKRRVEHWRLLAVLSEAGNRAFAAVGYTEGKWGTRPAITYHA